MTTTNVMAISFITNFFLIIFKIIFGIVGSSSALIADGIHSFSDLVTDVFAIIGIKIASKPADSKHPYGHGKLEYLISLIIGIIILFLGFNIIYTSTNKEIVIPSLIIVFVSLITIIVKLLLSNFIIKKGKEYNSNILISSGIESKTDVISSIIVLVSVILMNLSDKILFLKYTDIIATIIVGILIVKIGFNIIKENISALIEEQETNEELIKKVKLILLSDEKIYRVDDLVILKFGSYDKVIAEVGMDHRVSLLEAHNRIEKIEEEIKKVPLIKYVTIHINPYIDVKKYHLIKALEKDRKYIKNKSIKNYKMILLDNKKIGYINFYTKNNICYIDIIYLIKRYREKGIDIRIIKDIIKKYNEVIVISNNKTKLIYENLGFKKTDKNNIYVLKK